MAPPLRETAVEVHPWLNPAMTTSSSIHLNRTTPEPTTTLSAERTTKTSIPTVRNRKWTVRTPTASEHIVVRPRANLTRPPPREALRRGLAEAVGGGGNRKATTEKGERRGFLKQLAGRTEVEVQIFGLQAELCGDIANGAFELHQRATDVLDLLFGQRAAVHTSNRLPFEQL